MNLKLVQCFLMVGEHKSFKKAAQLSGLTQSAVSAQIKTFEEQLGYKVFERTTRSVKLNEKGAQLYDVAHIAVKMICGCLRSLDNEDLHSRGELRVACNSAMPIDKFDLFLSVLSTNLPNRKLTLVDMQSDAIEAAVEDGLVDLALTSGPSTQSLNFTPLLQSRLVVVAHNSLALDEEVDFRCSSLRDISIFVHCDDPEFGQISDLARPALIGGSEIYCRMSSAERLIEMVDRRHGIGIVWEHALTAGQMEGCSVKTLSGLTLQKAFGILSSSNQNDLSSISKALSSRLVAE